MYTHVYTREALAGQDERGRHVVLARVCLRLDVLPLQVSVRGARGGRRRAVLLELRGAYVFMCVYIYIYIYIYIYVHMHM